MKILDLCYGIVDIKSDKTISKKHIYIKNLRENVNQDDIRKLGRMLVNHAEFNNRAGTKVKFLSSNIISKGEEISLV